MSSVFLSHSSADRDFVRRLGADLRESGVHVWIDEAEIQVGDSLIRKIGDGINEVDYLAVVLSPSSVSSKWVNRELRLHLTKKSQPTTSRYYRFCTESAAFPHS